MKLAKLVNLIGGYMTVGVLAVMGVYAQSTSTAGGAVRVSIQNLNSATLAALANYGVPLVPVSISPPRVVAWIGTSDAGIGAFMFTVTYTDDKGKAQTRSQTCASSPQVGYDMPCAIMVNAVVLTSWYVTPLKFDVEHTVTSAAIQ